jgi:hypothetical protein
MPERQQFNVSLPAELVRRLKHHAIDVQCSLSDLVSEVLAGHLAATAPGLHLQPIVHVPAMADAVAFYEALGGEVVAGSRDGDWVQLRVAGAEIGLLAHPPNPEQGEAAVELSFASSEPLDRLEERLRAAGVDIARPTTDEGFGRQLQLAAPGGLLVKINELDPQLYG